MRWDRFSLNAEYLALGLTLFVLALRFVVTLRRKSKHEIDVESEAWMTWGVYLIIVVFAILHVPVTRRFFSAAIGAWFEPIPYIGALLIGYALWTRVCYRIEPNIKPHSDWPLYGAILTLADCMLVLRGADAGLLPGTVAFYRDTTVSALFSTMLLFISARIVLPTFAASHRKEAHPPMRLRLLLMACTQASVALMTINEIVSALARVVGGSYPSGPVRMLGAALFVMTFLVAYFPPARYYVWLIRRLNYLGSLRDFVYLRAFERQVYYHINRQLAPLPLQETLRVPDQAVYQSAIHILDASKLVRQCPDAPAHIKTELDSVTHPDYDYVEVVRRLREIGKGYVFATLAASIKTHIYVL
jgi:hypothetical protein